MLFKNILLAAGVIGAASAQSSAAGATGAADPAATSMASMSGPSGTMMSMSMSGKGGKKTHSPIPVPSDLSGGFKTDQITLKVHFKHGKKKGGKKKGKKGMSSSSSNGAATGTSSSPDASGTPGKKDKKGKKGKKHHKHKLNMKNTAKAPRFSLGKANGANAQSKWIIVMIDTTSANQRILHYVHSDYMMVQGKNGNGSAGGMGQMMQQMGNMAGQAGQKMGMKKGMPINSTTTPQMPWKGPGTMGDMGGKRMYTFLMYSQQGDFQAKGMPQPGQPIDMKQFVSQNNLQPAVAGKSIMVDTSSNGTKSGSAGAPGATDAVKAATGAASSLRSQIYGAGVVSTIFALGMALL